MEAKKSTKLPDGVGKKILEALKQQSENPSAIKQNEDTTEPEFLNNSEIINDDLTAYTENEFQESPMIEEEDDLYKIENTESELNILESEDKTNPDADSDTGENFSSMLEDDYNFKDNHQTPLDEDIYSETPEDEFDLDSFDAVEDNPLDTEKSIQQNRVPNISQPPQPSYQTENTDYERLVPKYNPNVHGKPPFYESTGQKTPMERHYTEDFESKNTSFEINPETNVGILMRLISRLPAGVTRQTGAQIIRQTMEAMGISMSKVLTEAQQFQDELAQSMRDHINTIEEYRNNIRTLEKEVQSHKKQSEELEDLISLFIMSDKNLKR